MYYDDNIESRCEVLRGLSWPRWFALNGHSLTIIYAPKSLSSLARALPALGQRRDGRYSASEHQRLIATISAAQWCASETGAPVAAAAPISRMPSISPLNFSSSYLRQKALRSRLTRSRMNKLARDQASFFSQLRKASLHLWINSKMPHSSILDFLIYFSKFISYNIIYFFIFFKNISNILYNQKLEREREGERKKLTRRIIDLKRQNADGVQMRILRKNRRHVI